MNAALMIFVAHYGTLPAFRVWLFPEDGGEGAGDMDPRDIPEWRIIIEQVAEDGSPTELRNAWEPTLQEAINHVPLYCPPYPPKWIDCRNARSADLPLPRQFK